MDNKTPKGYEMQKLDLQDEPLKDKNNNQTLPNNNQTLPTVDEFKNFFSNLKGINIRQ